MKIFSHYLAAFLCLALPLHAVAGPDAIKPEYDKVGEFFAAGLKGKDIKREAYVGGVVNYLRQSGMLLGTEVTKADVAKLKRRILANLRMKRVTLVLVADLDGDGTVTKEELTEYLSMPGSFIFVDDPRFMSKLVDANTATPPDPAEYVLSHMDRNKDGKITYDEMRFLPDESEVFSTRDANAMKINMLNALLAQDPNKDGKLTTTELEELAGKAFDIIDLNRDGILQEKEVQAYTKATQPAAAAKSK